jgi:hypothetical protein
MKKDDAHSSGSAWVHVPKPDDMDEDNDKADCCSRSLAIFDAFRPLVQEEAVSSALKLELHSVLNAFQYSPTYGVHVCESFKDPRKHNMDDYWSEVECEAFSMADMHHQVGGSQRQASAELSDSARARLHQFARALERLSRRIDRIVLHTDPTPAHSGFALV